MGCGGGGGGGDVTATVHTNLLPTYIEGVQEKAEEYLAAALALSGGNFSPYPDPTYAAQDANETDGIAAAATRGRYGSQVELDGKAHLRDLYDGNMLGTNDKLDDYFSAMFDELLQEFDETTLPAIRNAHVFAFGGSEHNVAEAKAASRMMANINRLAKIYYDDHRHERSLQQEGMAHATPYGLQCIRDMEMLRMAGVFAREYDQGAKKDAWEKWNEESIIPIRNLDILGNAVRTVLSTYRETQTKFYKPPVITQIAGLAMAGLSLYSMFSGTSLNPYGKSENMPATTKTSLVGNPAYSLAGDYSFGG